MTRKSLRGRCLREIGDFNPTRLMPDMNAAVMQAVRDFVQAAGGLKRTKEITLEAGTREYGTSKGFPSDFQSVRWVVRSDGIPMDPIYRYQRNETGSGTPETYYIENRVIGFGIIPNTVITVTLGYWGTGDDVTDDTTAMLTEFGLADNDGIWDVVAYGFAWRYFRLKTNRCRQRGDERGIAINTDAARSYELDFHSGAFRAKQRLVDVYHDKGIEIELPEDYFPRDRNGSFRSRASNTGDITRSW